MKAASSSASDSSRLSPATATVALKSEHLTRRFGPILAVDRLDLAIQPGELFGLVGPDGAGKTTTARLITGLLRPDSGDVRVLGLRVQDGSLAVRESIGYMPQQYSLYGDLSVSENLTFFGRLFGISRHALAEREARLLELTHLTRFRERRADALSGGMYKKLALACALLHRPKVLVLDEPTNGVDPVSRRDLWDLLYEFVSDGMAVLLATPYMDEAARCHRVGLMNRGRLLAEGAPADLVGRFGHETVVVRGEPRALVEAKLHERAEVLALSPQGTALRTVVRREGVAAFRAWMAAESPDWQVEPVRPDFEDVFLGLLADPASLKSESAP